LCEESPEARRIRDLSVLKVLAAFQTNSEIDNKLKQLRTQAIMMQEKINKEPNAHSKLGPDLRSFISNVVANTSELSSDLKETYEAAAVLDKRKIDRVPTPVACPNCGKINNVLLGQFPGATGAVYCESCGQQYNAHIAAGGLFTVPILMTTPQTEYISIKCPNPGCTEPPFNVANAIGDRKREERGCFGCGSIIEIDTGSRNATLIEKKSKKRGQIKDDKLFCIEDSTSVAVSIPRRGGRVGYCRQCKTVVTTENGH
jgi:hypothetical protein